MSGPWDLRRIAVTAWLAGYIVYLIPALIWGWSIGAKPFLGYAAWQAVLYAPMWPFVLLVQFYKVLVPLLVS